MKSFYERLYTPTVPLTSFIPPPKEAFAPFQKDEAMAALSSLRLGRSPGPDQVASEQLVLAHESIAEQLTVLLNKLIEGDDVPAPLVQATVTLLYKKGDPNDIANFRPISLVSGIYKALTRACLTRMEKTLNEHESPTQTGFRRGFSTIHNIHTLKQLAEKSKEYGGFPIYLALVDFQKAFDQVEWSALWTALTGYGIHPHLISLLKRLYENSITHVIVNGQKIEVNIKRGVKQGDTLSPQLFNVTLRHALDQIDWGDNGVKMGGKYLSSLEYADDLTIVAQSRPQLLKMLKIVKEASATVGLSINVKKTVLLSNCTTTRAPLTIDGDTYHFADSATYLGAHLSLPLDQPTELRRRLQAGWNAYAKLHEVLRSPRLSLAMKKRVFDACIMPTVLYGAETWALKASDKERLSVTQRRMERSMLGLHWSDRWTNERVRRTTGVKDWVMEARRRKLRWALQVKNLPNDRWAKIATEWIPYNRARTPGRPDTRWRDDMTNMIGPRWLSIDDEEYRTQMARHID